MASERHIHNASAMAWFADIDAEEAAFCRTTQAGLLRLLTNGRVMGVDVLTPLGAWEVYDRFARDVRVRFVFEPSGMEEAWRQSTKYSQPATNLWTDAYLQAFARLKGLHVVSFDRGFRRFGEPQPLILA